MACTALIFPHILRIEVFEANAGFDLIAALDPSMQDGHRSPASMLGFGPEFSRRGADKKGSFRQD
jgi:hypothetical protein